MSADYCTNSLSGDALALADAIREHMREHMKIQDNGGCRAFLSPKEYAESGGDKDDDAVLVLQGELSDRCDYEYCSEPEVQRFRLFLKSLGYWAESGGGRAAFVYRWK